jgi:outer membrane lipoprotein-sorting protein
VIRITRPLDKYEITITVEKISINQSLTDDQFDLKIPEGTVVQTLK